MVDFPTNPSPASDPPETDPSFDDAATDDAATDDAATDDAATDDAATDDASTDDAATDDAAVEDSSGAAGSPAAESSSLAEPPGLARSRAVATLMDDAIRVPGTNYRVGIDPIVGVLPVAGDLVMGLLSLYIVFEGLRLGVGVRTAVRMVFNIALDALLGSVPVVGDLFDVVWKANRRNVALIERHVEKQSA